MSDVVKDFNSFERFISRNYFKDFFHPLFYSSSDGKFTVRAKIELAESMENAGQPRNEKSFNMIILIQLLDSITKDFHLFFNDI